MNLTFRKMTQNDLPAAAALFLTTFGPEGFGEPWTLHTSTDHLTGACDPAYSYVAQVDGKAVGFLIATRQTFEHGPELYIDTFVVEPALRGQGIGTKLWEYGEKEARTKGCIGVRLVGNPKLQSFSWYHTKGISESGWIELAKRWE